MAQNLHLVATGDNQEGRRRPRRWPMTCVLATCRDFFPQSRSLAPDDLPLQRVLGQRGILTAIVPWEATEFAWSRAEVVVIRSTWNYHLHPDRFLAWAACVAAASRLLNPLPVVRWNVDKWRYLADLREAGLPTIPTRRLEQGERVDLHQALRESGWTQAVLKPRIGANAYATLMVDTSSPQTMAQGQAHLDRFLAVRDMLVQPYLPQVRESGERSHVFIDGAWSHAYTRVPFCERHGEIAGERLLRPAPAEVALAECVMQSAERLLGGEPLLFGRVDLVYDEAGQLRLMELELLEPVLHLEAGDAVSRLADALVARLASDPAPVPS